MVGCGCGCASCNEDDKRSKTYNAPPTNGKVLKKCLIERLNDGWLVTSGGREATVATKKEAKRWCASNCGRPGTCVNVYGAESITMRADDGSTKKQSFWEWQTTPPQKKEKASKPNKEFPKALREE